MIQINSNDIERIDLYLRRFHSSLSELHMDGKVSDDSSRKSKSFKKYTRYVLDPFQIFCIEKRSEFLLEHPELKNSEVTSILGSIWRNMPQEEKQTYNTLAMRLKNNKCSVQRKIKKPINEEETLHEEIKDRSKGSTEGSEPDVEYDNGGSLHIPRIHVISRSGVGSNVSEISKILLAHQEEPKRVAPNKE